MLFSAVTDALVFIVRVVGIAVLSFLLTLRILFALCGRDVVTCYERWARRFDTALLWLNEALPLVFLGFLVGVLLSVTLFIAEVVSDALTRRRLTRGLADCIIKHATAEQIASMHTLTAMATMCMMDSGARRASGASADSLRRFTSSQSTAGITGAGVVMAVVVSVVVSALVSATVVSGAELADAVTSGPADDAAVGGGTSGCGVEA